MNTNEFSNADIETPWGLSAVVITLLKGVVEQANDGKLWDALITLQPRIKDYVSTLGLELTVDEAEGYAFLRSKTCEEENGMPRLVARRPLSFHTSLMLALLRKKLVEFDSAGGGTRLILSISEIAELIRVFLPETTNEVRLINQIETIINKVVELGFLRKLKVNDGASPTFEVRRILKAFVDAQWLSDFDERLAEYRRLCDTATEVPTHD